MKLTQEQFEKLSPEQQEAFGAAEAGRIKRRQELLEKVRESRYRVDWGALFMGVLFLGCLFAFGSIAVAEPEHRLLAIFTLVFAIVFTNYRVACVAKRQDALVQFIEGSLKEANKDG